MSDQLSQTVSSFGQETKPKFANAAISRAPEDQLRRPLDALVRAAAEIDGFPAGAVRRVGEAQAPVQ